MTDKKIIMAGLANSKTSLGEVFRRYIECFQFFNNPDIYDLGKFSTNSVNELSLYQQYSGIINHNIRYFHTPFQFY